MRIYLSTLFFVISFVTNAVADIEGQMYCKVKSQNIMGIEDGIPNNFSHYTDQFQVGETLTIFYDEFNQNFRFRIFDLLRDQNLFEFDSKNFTSPNFVGEEDLNFVVLNNDGSQSPRMLISSDWIDVRNNRTNLDLRRYYKDDWEGLVVTHTTNSVHAYTLDCRSSVNKLDEFLLQLREGVKLQQLEKS